MKKDDIINANQKYIEQAVEDTLINLKIDGENLSMAVKYRDESAILDGIRYLKRDIESFEKAYKILVETRVT